MTNIEVFDTDAKRLDEASTIIGEDREQIIQWLIEEHLDDLVKEMEGSNHV